MSLVASSVNSTVGLCRAKLVISHMKEAWCTATSDTPRSVGCFAFGVSVSRNCSRSREHASDDGNVRQQIHFESANDIILINIAQSNYRQGAGKTMKRQRNSCCKYATKMQIHTALRKKSLREYQIVLQL